MKEIKQRLLQSLIEQRENISESILDWANKNTPNFELNQQLINIDIRIDQLLIE